MAATVEAAPAYAMKTLIEGPGRMSFHTHLAPLFEAVGERLESLQWLLTECEVLGSAGFPRSLPRILKGTELRRIALQGDPQFVWAVMSGFDPAVPIDLDRLAIVPSVDGNGSVWDPQGGPQYPGATVEIVCFDSSATIVTSGDANLHRRLREYFPEAKPMPPLPSAGSPTVA